MDTPPLAPHPPRVVLSKAASLALHALGCLAAAFLAASAAAFAAWMTALPEGLRTMPLDAARRRFNLAAGFFLVACLAGAWLLVRVVQRARRAG